MDGKQHNHRRGLVALLMTVLLGGCQQDNRSQEPTSTLYFNGKIYTQDGQRSLAEAMVVEDGKFRYVGSRQGAESFMTNATRQVDLQGRMVLPGQIGRAHV